MAAKKGALLNVHLAPAPLPYVELTGVLLVKYHLNHFICHRANYIHKSIPPAWRIIPTNQHLIFQPYVGLLKDLEFSRNLFIRLGIVFRNGTTDSYLYHLSLIKPKWSRTTFGSAGVCYQNQHSVWLTI